MQMDCMHISWVWLEYDKVWPALWWIALLLDYYWSGCCSKGGGVLHLSMYLTVGLQQWHDTLDKHPNIVKLLVLLAMEWQIPEKLLYLSRYDRVAIVTLPTLLRTCPTLSAKNILHSQCVTNLEVSQAFSSSSNVGRLKFDQHLVKGLTFDQPMTIGDLDLDYVLTNKWLRFD